MVCVHPISLHIGHHLVGAVGDVVPPLKGAPINIQGTTLAIHRIANNVQWVTEANHYDFTLFVFYIN